MWHESKFVIIAVIHLSSPPSPQTAALLALSVLEISPTRQIKQNQADNCAVRHLELDHHI